MSFVIKPDSDYVKSSATTDRRFPIRTIKNGQLNPMLVTLENGADNFLDLVSVGASFHDPRRGWRLIRNATTQTFQDTWVPPHDRISVPYSFYSDFPPSHPLGLTIYLNTLTSFPDPKTPHRTIAFNGTVTVIEPPGTSLWQDPGLLTLYAILLASMVFAGWSSWGVLKGKWAGGAAKWSEEGGKKVGKGARGEGSRRKLVVVPATSGKPYPESAKPYEEEWIPVSQLKKRPGGKIQLGEAQEAVADATSGRRVGSAVDRHS